MLARHIFSFLISIQLWFKPKKAPELAFFLYPASHVSITTQLPILLMLCNLSLLAWFRLNDTLNQVADVTVWHLLYHEARAPVGRMSKALSYIACSGFHSGPPKEMTASQCFSTLLKQVWWKGCHMLSIWWGLNLKFGLSLALARVKDKC